MHSRRLLTLLAAVALSIPAATASAFALAMPALPEASPSQVRFAQVTMGMLAALPVEPEATAVPYDRDAFGGWIDADRDGCNTRREVLQLESLEPVTITDRCTVTTGEWVSPFDGRTAASAQSLDIDHMVPLKEAWVSGAHEWSFTTLRSYANDLGYEHSLIAVTAASNRAKSDQDPATWLPSDISFVCQYLGRWVGVKYRWDLSVDELERQVLAAGIERCGASSEVTEPQRAEIVLAAGQPGSSAGSESTSSGLTSFANCSALNAVFPGGIANSSGAVNIANGRIKPTRWPVTVHPELYAAHMHLDRDKDGIACER